MPAWAPDYAKTTREAQVAANTPTSAEDGPTSDEPSQSGNRLARALWTALGVVAFGLGTLGTVLPILPTVPLYLAALFCFAKGSQRLHDWFVNTNLYHKHLEDFVDHRGMTLRTKLSIMGMVTLVMGIAFLLMGRVPVGRVILVIVWLAHVVFFVGFVKTQKPGEADDDDNDAGETADISRPVPAWAPSDQRGLVPSVAFSDELVPPVKAAEGEKA